MVVVVVGGTVVVVVVFAFFVAVVVVVVVVVVGKSGGKGDNVTKSTFSDTTKLEPSQRSTGPSMGLGLRQYTTSGPFAGRGPSAQIH